jgi:hypothetical protein
MSKQITFCQNISIHTELRRCTNDEAIENVNGRIGSIPGR